MSLESRWFYYSFSDNVTHRYLNQSCGDFQCMAVDGPHLFIKEYDLALRCGECHQPVSFSIPVIYVGPLVVWLCFLPAADLMMRHKRLPSVKR